MIDLPNVIGALYLVALVSMFRGYRDVGFVQNGFESKVRIFSP
jgi:hypothetical protein